MYDDKLSSVLGLHHERIASANSNDHPVFPKVSKSIKAFTLPKSSKIRLDILGSP